MLDEGNLAVVVAGSGSEAWVSILGNPNGVRTQYDSKHS